MPFPPRRRRYPQDSWAGPMDAPHLPRAHRARAAIPPEWSAHRMPGNEREHAELEHHREPLVGVGEVELADLGDAAQAVAERVLVDEERVGCGDRVAEVVEPGTQRRNKVAVVAAVVADETSEGAAGLVAAGGGDVAELQDQRLALELVEAADPAVGAAVPEHAQGPVDSGAA